MPLTVFFITISLFIISFILHLIIWRIKLPLRQINFLFKLFFSILLLFIISAVFIPVHDWLPFQTKLDFLALTHISLFYFCLVMAYLISYTVIQSIGPSFLILLNLDHYKTQGLTQSEIETIISKDSFIIDRIAELKADSLIDEEPKHIYSINKNGRSYLRIFNLYRDLLRVEKNGG